MPGNFSYVISGELAGCAEPGRFSSLHSDLAGLDRLGIGAIVSLTEQRLDARSLRDFSFRTLHLPVVDFASPSRAQIEKFVAFVDACREESIPVVVHCAAGMGRTGTMLACYLVSLGHNSNVAIREVREFRPGSIETLEQEKCIADYYKNLEAELRDRK